MTQRPLMNRMIGFILFWIGIGMFIALIFPDNLCMVLIAGALLVVGYNLFCH